MLTCLEYVTKNVDEGSRVDVIYLDFSKPFDSVPYESLLMKIRSVGTYSNTVDRVKYWSRSRKPQVVLRGTSSNWQSVTSGVLQGSVLGPHLFLIYINDIDEGMVGKIIKFVDDPKLFRDIRNEQDGHALHKEIEQ